MRIGASPPFPLRHLIGTDSIATREMVYNHSRVEGRMATSTILGRSDGLELHVSHVGADLEQFVDESPGVPILGNLRLSFLDGLSQDDPTQGLTLDSSHQRPAQSVTRVYPRGALAGGLAIALAETRRYPTGTKVAKVSK